MYGFIYITTNHVNGKKYIGQRKYDNQDKWKEYLGSGVVLSKAIKKYGVENFSKQIIEDCKTKEELNLKEKFWINHYDAVNSDDFYNIAEGGDGGNTLVGYTEKQLEEHRKKLSNVLKGKINQGINNPMAKQVICLNNMKIFDTLVDAGIYGGVSDNAIRSCCSGISHTSGLDPITKEKLQWEYYDSNKEYNFKKIKRKTRSDKRKVICHTTGEIFDSAKEASDKYNLSESGIRTCCNFKYSYYGTLEDGLKLQWFYYDYYISNDFNISKHPINEGVSKKERILMYDLKGNFEKEFSSRKEANKFTGDHKGGCGKILECLNNKRKTAYGHIWKYAS